MKRRDFLKILGVLAVAPGAAIAAIKVKPKPVISIDVDGPSRWRNFYAEYIPTEANRIKFCKAIKKHKFQIHD